MATGSKMRVLVALLLLATGALAAGVNQFYTTDPHLVVQLEFKNADMRHLTHEMQERAIEQYARFVAEEFDVDARVIRSQLSLGGGNHVRGIRSLASLRILPPQQRQMTVESLEATTTTVTTQQRDNNDTFIRAFNVQSALKTLNAKRDQAATSVLDTLQAQTTGRNLNEYVGWRHPLQLSIRVAQDSIVKLDAKRPSSTTSKLPPRKSAKNGEEVVIPTEEKFKPRLVSYSATAQNTASSAPWPLDRLNQVTLPLDGNGQRPAALIPSSTYSNVPVYIMDTGVLATHVEFGTRVELVYDQFPSETQHNGHGTHVASDCCGNTIGTSPYTDIKDIRTLDSTGSASWFDITVAGEALLTDCTTRGLKNTTGCVINMSFGGAGNPNSTDAEPFGTILSYIRDECDAAIVAAAGNSADDACMTIPAGYSDTSQGRVLAVGATDSSDQFASFSNLGPCVFMNAPGVDVLGAWNTATDAYAFLSGTSMASPTLAGVLALDYLWFQGTWSQDHPGELRADHVRAFAYDSGVCVVQSLPASTTCALIHYSTTPIDPNTPIQDITPLLPIGESGVSTVAVGALFVAFVILLGLLL